MRPIEEEDELAQERRIARMEMIDRYPEEMRKLVHEYGWALVNQFINCGIDKPRQIRHLVETTLDEFSPTRGTHSFQGLRGALPRPDELKE